MKHLLALSFFALTSTLVLAQNWAPLTEGTRYNYALNDATKITNTLFIDSTQSDTAYLNRIAKTLDDWQFDLRNQPQFLMREMIDEGEGWYSFRDTSNFRINTLGEIGENWIFDEENNLTATIFLVDEEYVLGQTDSIKKLILSNSDIITLSKNHGIIEMQNSEGVYKLIGLSGNTQLGEQYVTRSESFNYTIGDERYEFESFYWGGGGGGIQSSSSSKRFEIVDVEYSDTYVTIYRDGISKSYNWAYDVVFNEFQDSVVYYYEDGPWSIEHPVPEYYNMQVRPIVEFMPVQEGLGGGEALSIVNYDVYLERKSVFIGYSYGGWLPESGGVYYNTESDTMWFGNEFFQGFHTMYAEGLGLVAYNDSYFEYSNQYNLLGYVHEGDTVGNFPSDAVFLGIESPTKPQQLSIFPNPATDLIHVEEEGLKKIYNIQGAEVLQTTDEQIDISSLKPGQYFIVLEKHNARARFIKSQ